MTNNQNTKGLSDVAQTYIEDLTSEKDTPNPHLTTSSDDSANIQPPSDEDEIIDPSPASVDEQSISGTAPAPSSDDDTLANAQLVGTQLDETENGEGKVEEVDIARDIDTAEEYYREH